MKIDDEILNGFNITIASSAQQFKEVAESIEKAKKVKKLGEQNSPTNHNLKKIIEQNDLKIRQSEEQIKLLEAQNNFIK